LPNISMSFPLFSNQVSCQNFFSFFFSISVMPKFDLKAQKENRCRVKFIIKKNQYQN
jgi:hypothetical protein